MKRFLILAVAAAALTTSACVTIIDADGVHDGKAWHGENAQPFDSARDQCRADNHGRNVEAAFRECMARKGWTRS